MGKYYADYAFRLNNNEKFFRFKFSVFLTAMFCVYTRPLKLLNLLFLTGYGSITLLQYDLDVSFYSLDQCQSNHNGCRVGICHPAQYNRQAALWPGNLHVSMYVSVST